MRIAWFDLPVLAMLVATSWGCTPEPRWQAAPSGTIARPDRAAVIFFADGLDHRRFAALLEARRLPNIQRRLVDGGVSVAHPIVSLPSITYPNTVSLLTGRFPGHHGILGNRWFDPHILMLRDYGKVATFRAVNHDFRSPTLYEILSDHLTVSVQCHTRRGASHTIDNPITSGLDWLFGAYTRVDARTAGEIENVKDLARRVRRWPSVLLLYFPGVDEVGHRFGPDSPEYEAAVINVDVQVGRVIRTIEGMSLADRTYFVLVTDHGHVVTGPCHTVDLVKWLRQRRGLRVRTRRVEDADYALRFARLDPYDAVVVNGVYRRLAIYLRGPQGWSQRPDADAVNHVLYSRQDRTGQADQAEERLVDVPGVGLVCIRDGPNSVRVFSRRAEAVVQRRRRSRNAEYKMVSLDAGRHARLQAGGARPDSRLSFSGPAGSGTRGTRSSDPLGYGASPETATFIASGWHTSREWLQATADTPYPDFVPQIVEMFDSRRAGDIVVFADSDWAFSPRDRSGHGSSLAADMRGVMLFAGPDLPRGGQIRFARIVDVMPTLLELLGESDRLAGLQRLDGVSVAGALRAAGRISEAPVAAGGCR